jgi:hypothetical protein
VLKPIEHVPVFVGHQPNSCQWIVNLQSNFAVYVLIFVTLVLKNVKDIQIWIIASNVLKPVENVLMNVEEWLAVVKDFIN